MNDEELEEYYNEQQGLIGEAVERAVSYNWGLTNFKRFVSQFLKTKNTEDQWTFDYESWVLSIYLCKDYQHPSRWARDYYAGRWDENKWNELMESLARIARGEEKPFNPTKTD